MIKFESKSNAEGVPGYAATMETYHKAFAAELFDVLKLLPLRQGDAVLDLACGDGIYSYWMQELAGPNGRVVALDLDCNWMQAAEGGLPLSEVEPFPVQGNALRLPFADDTFDLVWCAQSFCTLDDVTGALHEMTRVVRPGGVVAVLENDTLHQVILPWSPELELAIRTAEFQSLKRRALDQGGDYVGRDLIALLMDAGLVGVKDHLASFTRRAPLDAPTRHFLESHLASLERRAESHLSRKMRDEMRELLHCNGESWLDQPDFSIACLERLAWGTKPVDMDPSRQ